MQYFPVIAVCLCVLGACSEKKNTAVLQATEDSRIHYFMAGTVVSEDYVDIKSKITSQVLAVEVEIGDPVRRGQPLVLLEKKDIGAQMESIRKRYENSRRDLERIRELYKTGSVSHQFLETAEYNFKTAETALEVARIQEENGTLISPIDGIVSSVKIKEGEIASPNTVLLTIVDPENLFVEAYLPEQLLYLVHPGMSVDLLINSISLQGLLSVIDPVIDPYTRNILLKIAINESQTDIRPGMFALAGKS